MTGDQGKIPALIDKARHALGPLHRSVAAGMPLVLRRHYLYFGALGTWGNFDNPQTFNEKLNWRIIHDRRPELVRACDKLEMKKMAREAVPGPELRIPETFWAGEDLVEGPDPETLPQWVLKPNNTSSQILLGPASTDEVLRLCDEWRGSVTASLGEWGYTEVKRQYYYEERVPCSDGGVPQDFKVLVFGGEPRAVQVHSNRFRSNYTATYYDVDWNRLQGRWTTHASREEPRPERLDDLLDIAARLAKGWDHLRVDLYLVDNEIWFGEYTPYHGGGLLRYTRGFDEWLGSWWTLPSLDEVSGQPGRTTTSG